MKTYSLNKEDLNTLFLGLATLINSTKRYGGRFWNKDFEEKIEIVCRKVYDQDHSFDSDLVKKAPMHLGSAIKEMFEFKENVLTIKKLRQEVKEKYFNILCTDICGSQAYRVIGVAEDDLDFYYITKAINGEIKYQTALISPIPLISLEQYKQLDEVYEQNGCSKEETLVIDYKMRDIIEL